MVVPVDLILSRRLGPRPAYRNQSADGSCCKACEKITPGQAGDAGRSVPLALRGMGSLVDRKHRGWFGPRVRPRHDSSCRPRARKAPFRKK